MHPFNAIIIQIKAKTTFYTKLYNVHFNMHPFTVPTFPIKIETTFQTKLHNLICISLL